MHMLRLSQTYGCVDTPGRRVLQHGGTLQLRQSVPERGPSSPWQAAHLELSEVLEKSHACTPAVSYYEDGGSPALHEDTSESDI